MSSTSYAEITERFGEIFRDIGRGDRARESGRHLPLIPLNTLRESGLGALTVPAEAGGLGADYETTLRVLKDLAAEDANLAHIWRSHLAFVEYLKEIGTEKQLKQVWWPRLLAGEWGGSALSAKADGSETPAVVTEDDLGTLKISGTKYYTTGTLAATWTIVSADLDHELALKKARQRRRRGESGVTVKTAASALAVVRVRQPRVQVRDDWDGFGQRLTATGSLVMKGASVDDIFSRPVHGTTVHGFLEASLLAIQAGIAEAALRDGVDLMRKRTRVFNTSTGATSREDSQLLGIIGELSANVATAEELVRAAGRELDAGDTKAAMVSCQRSAILVPKLVLDVCTRIFDTLGASATSSGLELDRHWRNARTLATHDPTAFKARMIGDWVVNRKEPVPFVPVNPDTPDDED